MTAPREDPADLPAVAARLITTIDELTKSIHELLERTAKSEKQTRWQWVAIVAIALLFAVQGFSTYQQVQTNKAVIEASKSAGATRSELCSLYSVFLGSYNPSTRAPGTDRDTYELTYKTFREGYNRLECTTPYVPPATPRSSPPPR